MTDEQLLIRNLRYRREQKTMTDEQLLIRRPKLSMDNLEAFYKLIKYEAPMREVEDIYKNVFNLFQLNQNVTPLNISKALNMEFGAAKKYLIQVLRFIHDIETGYSDEYSKTLKPKQIIICHDPRPYRYTDQFGKTWWCVNEFYGLK